MTIMSFLPTGSDLADQQQVHLVPPGAGQTRGPGPAPGAAGGGQDGGQVGRPGQPLLLYLNP